MLREFFVNEEPKFLFKQFGLIHIIFCLIPVIALIIIYLNRNKISKIPKEKSKKILKICAIILLLNMLIFTIGFLYYGVFDYKKHLPFHLCFIANYMFMYGILFDKEWILKYTIFLCFIGPIPAILWPDMVSTIDNYEWWQYVISHHFFISVSFFSYYALGYNVNFKDYIKVFIFTNILMLIMYPFNITFDTNYIFSTKIPDNVMILYPWLKYFPPMLVLEVVGLIISGLIYYFIIRKRNLELTSN
ncbi:MAG: TIGR02206 family membrane protein [Candidatus Coprovivens sp.]